MKYKYKICVSGSAVTEHCSECAPVLVEEIGKEIIRHNGILITGTTSGIPYFAARGADKAGGISIGFSPAASEREHVKTYRLPTDYFDIIVYTGFNYSGRNLLMTRASDGIIFVCGRMGTLNEFTIAFEDRKPMGILEGTGGTADKIRKIVAEAHRGKGKIVYDRNPKRLVEKLIELIEKEEKYF